MRNDQQSAATHHFNWIQCGNIFLAKRLLANNKTLQINYKKIDSNASLKEYRHDETNDMKSNSKFQLRNKNTTLDQRQANQFLSQLEPRTKR